MVRAGITGRTRQTRIFIAAAGFSLLTAACGNQKKAGEEDAAKHSAAPAAVVDAATAGSVSGIVRLDGPVPAPRKIIMSGDSACSVAGREAPLSQDVVADAQGHLANVVVYLKGGIGNFSYPVPKTPVEFDQQGCMYIPHVAAAMTGQTVVYRNSDKTTHNVHSQPDKSPPWNRSQPPGAPAIEVSFSHAEVAIPVKCNVHPWMRSYLAVFDHPYFAVTGADGSFEIRNLPPGKYTLEVWHEKYGTLSQPLVIAAKQAVRADFAFRDSAGAEH